MAERRSMIGEYKKEYKKEEEERLVAGGKDPLDKWVKKKKKEGAVEDADAAEDAALDAALEPALWVERGHSHVHCAVAPGGGQNLFSGSSTD